MVRALGDQSQDNAAWSDLVAHLIDYTHSLAAGMLEDELFEIVAPLLSHAADRVPVLLARLGWDGGPVRTLAESGEAAGVTRERIRQMQRRLEAKLMESDIWTPVLDRALAVISRRVPLPANQVGQALQRAGLSRIATFEADGLIQAQQLFGRAKGLEIREIEGIPFVIDERSAASADIADRLAAIRTAIAKQVGHQGLASIPEIAGMLRTEGHKAADHEILALLTALDHNRVIDGGWIVPMDT